MTLLVLTANRLADGISVWYDSDGTWNEAFACSQVARTAEDAARLEAIGKQALADNLVLDVNLVEIEEAAAGIQPLRMREKIRAAGPSIVYMANQDAKPSVAA